MSLSVQAAVRLIQATLGSPPTAFQLAAQISRHTDRDSNQLSELMWEAWSEIDESLLANANSSVVWEWKETGVKLAADRPTETGQHCLGMLFRSLKISSFLVDNPFALVVSNALSSDPELWTEVGDALENVDTGDQYIAASELQSFFPEAALYDRILEWSRQGGPKRAYLASLHSGAPTDTDASLGAALLDEYPDNEEVASQGWGVKKSLHWHSSLTALSLISS